MTRNAAISAILPVYAQAPVAFERGEGAYLFGSDGRRYLDFASGIAVTALGHAHPHLVAALTEQAGKVWHVSNLFTIPGYERLAERLIAHSFAETVFVANSGAEALECAIKMVRRYHWARGEEGRHRIVTFKGAFHGRTMATIAAGGQAKYLEGFRPELPGFDQIEAGDLAALADAVTDETAGVLIEPVQGEGGVRAIPDDFLRELRRVCDAHGLLLIFDEVQCGMGRAGALFAHERAGVTPDVMALAKGLGGGFPIGACLATARAASGMAKGVHGTTFGGNPLACAVANAVLDVVLDPGFLPRVREVGDVFRDRLEALAGRFPNVVAEVRGVGLLLGVRVVPSNIEVATALRERGLLTVPAGDNVVRLLPPLIIGEAEIDEALTAIEDVCHAFAPAAA